MTTPDTLIREWAVRLSQTSDSPRLDAETLIRHPLNWSVADLIRQGLSPVCDEDLAKVTSCLERRLNGEPVAYITGVQEFWSLSFKVTPDTLIPRPETELLVERVLELVGLEDTAAICDLGTGSGAIAIAIASERPRARITAVDASAAALEIARANALSLGVDHIRFIQGNWLAAVTGFRFDVIVSNPPYVRDNDPHLGEGDVRAEPLNALVAGSDGLDAIREIIHAAKSHLSSPGMVLLEHGMDQGEEVRGLFTQTGFSKIRTQKDLQGHDRTTEAWIC